MNNRFSTSASFFSLAISIIGVFSFAGIAHAQTTAPSRIVPDNLAPALESEDRNISLPQTTMTAAPAGSENLNVSISAVSIRGGEASLSTAVQDIARPFEGRTVTVAELYGVAARIEALYARNGFILTRATVPPQDLKDGSVFRIVIVEGFIEAIDDSAVDSAVRGPVARRLAGLVGARGLTSKQIERHILLAARVPGVSLETTLVPGNQVGGAKLILQPQYRALQGVISANNHLSDAYDNFSFDAQLVSNSMLRLGEQIYVLGSTATDLDLFGKNPMRRVVGIGAYIPIGSDGLTLNEEYVRADTTADSGPGSLPVSGKLDRLTAALRYPAILTRNETLNLFGGIEVINEVQSITGLNARLSEDRLRFLSLGAEWGKVTGQNMNIGVQLAFDQGLKAFGARDQEDVLRTGILLSRQGSRPDFSKIDGAFSLNQQLSNTVRADFILRGQLSLSGTLPSSAQFSLDGSGALSGFAIGAINVDSGATARFQLSKTFLLNGSTNLIPYLFAASATGRLSNPSAVEIRHPDGWSLGGGLRGAIDEHISLSCEFAHSHSNLFANDRTRLTASVSFEF